MVNRYPKFDKKINEMIMTSEMQKQKTRTAVLASYDVNTNSAKIMLEDRYSDQITDVLTGVPCPMIQRSTDSRSRSWSQMFSWL
jgi:hypothetical protein